MKLASIAAGILMMVQSVQTPETFKMRLAAVPIETAMRNTVAGNGSATAIFDGTKLSISGTFDGLPSPATVARLHQGKVTGIRGAAVADLEVSKATNGSVTGSIALTAAQIESLRKGRLYIQIHSEKAPDGNLWGWLLR